MKYLGSKNKISKYLLPILLQNRNNKTWIEPFVGGANLIDKIDGNRIGNDNNHYLISLFIALQNGYIPPDTISKDLYIDIKNNKENYPKELVGFVGFCCSFGAKFFNGYATDKTNRNYALEGKTNLLKQIKNLQNVKFFCGNYYDLDIPENSLIYCDPPYEGTTKYNTKFNHNEFWNWCRNKSLEGHLVYISEYNSPKDFECIFEHETFTNFSLQKNINTKRIEKLFVYKG
jgi:DNA adenine methylase